jgi:PhnB protein
MPALNPYLNFDGDCRAAMTFYQACLGGELALQPFGAGMPNLPPGAEERVMHARLSGGALLLMASDTMPGMPLQVGSNVWLNVNCESLEEIERLFATLGAGGTPVMPLQDTFWGARFGMLRDRFGVQWMFNFEQGTPPA